MFLRLCTIFLLALGVTPVFAAGNEPLAERTFVNINPPQPIPPFLFEDEQGQTLDLKEFRGRYVLLNLWSTSCLPCVAEMPALNELSKKLDKKKFAIIALAEDHDGASAAKGFYQRHKIDHLKIFSDPTGRAPFALDARGLPTTLLINPEGQEIARLEGAADWTHDAMVDFLKTRATP